jgi:hypothetical protein
VLDGRIISIEARHPLVMGKADRGDVLFQPPSERGFPDAEETVDQVSRGHSRFDGAGRTLFWAICDKRGTRRRVALIKKIGSRPVRN